MTFEFLRPTKPRGINDRAFCRVIPANIGGKPGIRVVVSKAMQKKYGFKVGDRVLLGHDAEANSFALVKHHKGYKLNHIGASEHLSCRMSLVPNSPFAVPEQRLDYGEHQVEKVDGMYVLKPDPILPEASYEGGDAEDAHLPA